MDLSSYTIGYAVTGSFCTFEKTKKAAEELKRLGADLVPIFSYNVQMMDTRFGGAREFMEAIENIAQKPGIKTIQQAEPIGPKSNLDVLVIAPCTGNTLSKLWNGITDSPVLMAAKAHLRNQKPLVISVSTNDAMGMNFKNIGNLMNCKNIYFVPFGQDDWKKKPASLIGNMEMLPDTIECALNGEQIQPVIL